jgi:hypothetical protein
LNRTAALLGNRNSIGSHSIDLAAKLTGMATLKKIISPPTTQQVADNPGQDVGDLFETLDKQALKSIAKSVGVPQSHHWLSLFVWCGLSAFLKSCRSR